MTSRILVAALLAALAGCTFNPDPDLDRFVCSTQADCGEGYQCVLQKGGEAAGKSLCWKASEVVAPEKCDALDGDRDGLIDNDVPEVGKACATGEKGECATGKYVCDGALECPAPSPGVETCNLKDDDCDGTTDEDYDLKADEANCGGCGNVCGAGAECQDGGCVEVVCSDGIDNDVDSVTDCADPACEAKTCADFGKICLASECACPGAEAAGELTCSDALDNDCDGQTDCADADCAGKTCATGTCTAGTCQ